MTDDEYRELEEAALEAIGALLRRSEPGTGLGLHREYAELKRILGKPAHAATATTT